jgi:hypothetical protein
MSPNSPKYCWQLIEVAAVVKRASVDAGDVEKGFLSSKGLQESQPTIVSNIVQSRQMYTGDAFLLFYRQGKTWYAIAQSN